MVKFKTKIKDCQLKVRVKLSYDENIDFTELDSFSRKMLRGFLKPKRVKTRVIEYSGPVGVSIYERMKKPITKHDFFLIIAQIVDCTQKLLQNKFSIGNVIWNTDNVYINEATKEVQLIYLPYSSFSNTSDVISFFNSVIYLTNPAVEPDTDYASNFMYFIRNLRSYDSNLILNYINNADKSVIGIIKKHTGVGSGYMTDKQKDYLNHYVDEERTGLLEDDEKTGLLLEDEKTGLLQDEEATGLLDEDATGLLVEETALLEENQIHYPTLLRVFSNETIQINKPVFRIGKEKSFVDYFVSNNAAVSRSHADIITRGQRFFVVDLNSKNRTFVNGQVIPVHQEVEIFNGNQLRLANEEFVFYV